MSKYTINKYLSLIDERPYEFIGNQIQIITNKSKLEEYEINHNCDLGLIYESPYHILLKDLVCADNKLFTYERLLKKAPHNAVVMIPIFKGKFVLIKQFRHALRESQLCFPRGFGELGLSILENAKKELYEELGCQTLSCEILGQVIADSGICGDKVSICLCNISNFNIKPNYEGIESVSLLSLEEILELINKQAISDSFTISALNLYIIKNNLIIKQG